MNGLEIGLLVFEVLLVLAGLYNGLIRSIFGIVAFLISSVGSFFITKGLAALIAKDGVVTAWLYVIMFIVIYLLIVFAGMMLNFISKLPLLSSANRICGAILLAALGVLFIMVFFSVLPIFAEAGYGGELLTMAKESKVLSVLLENNLLADILENIIF